MVNWLRIVQQLAEDDELLQLPEPMQVAAETVEMSFDDAGVTVVSDLDGDGRIDHVARMGYDGAAMTCALGEWGLEIEAVAPEKGQVIGDWWG